MVKSSTNAWMFRNIPRTSKNTLRHHMRDSLHYLIEKNMNTNSLKILVYSYT